MSKPEGDKPNPERQNPERKSDAAILCLCIGIGLVILGQFLGAGAAVTAALAGVSPSAYVGGVGGMIGAIFAVVAGAILCFVGAVWIAIRVIADSRDGAKERYGKVER